MRREAREILLDQTVSQLDAKKWKALGAALDHPPRDKPRLRALCTTRDWRGASSRSWRRVRPLLRGLSPIPDGGGVSRVRIGLTDHGATEACCTNSQYET